MPPCGPPAFTSGHPHLSAGRDNPMISADASGEPTIAGIPPSASTDLLQSESKIPRVRPLPQPHADIKMPVPFGDGQSPKKYPDGENAGDEPCYTDSEDSECLSVKIALLSHLAVRLRDHVPRGTHIKGGIPYSKSFTGKDIVVSIPKLTCNEMARNSYHRPDNGSSPDTVRTCEPRGPDRRPKGGHRDRAQSPKPALFP
jgi:hypothetical protein